MRILNYCLTIETHYEYTSFLKSTLLGLIIIVFGSQTACSMDENVGRKKEQELFCPMSWEKIANKYLLLRART